MSQSFTFNLFPFSNDEVIKKLREALESYETIEAFKVTDGDNFYVSIYIPEQGNDVRIVDVHNMGDNDFEVSISEMYDLRAIIDLPCLDDCFITEVERFNAFDTVKYVCRHWGEL